MALTKEKVDARKQLETARENLGRALGLTQDITSAGLDVGQVSASLAGAVKCIFFIQKNGADAPESFQKIEETMEHLRETLRRLQDVAADDPSLTEVTKTVARILAIIYPISKEIEKIQTLSDTITGDEASSPEEQPIPLTQAKAPAPRVSAAPIPLIEKQGLHRLSSPPKEGERRSSDRRIIQVDIGIQSETNFFTGFTEDISSGGLFIATYDLLAIGTKLNVNFTIPKGPVLSLDGIVRWVREHNEANPEVPPGMGIQFEKLNGQNRELINRFMVENPPIFYDDL